MNRNERKKWIVCLLEGPEIKSKIIFKRNHPKGKIYNQIFYWRVDLITLVAAIGFCFCFSCANTQIQLHNMCCRWNFNKERNSKRHIRHDNSKTHTKNKRFVWETNRKIRTLFFVHRNFNQKFKWPFIEKSWFQMKINKTKNTHTKSRNYVGHDLMHQAHDLFLWFSILI